ncbi:MAG: Swt1 family HEPN domain-containing protein [Pseudolabrys sp.]
MINEPAFFAKTIADLPLGAISKAFPNAITQAHFGMASMHSPWVNTQNALSSASGFTELFALGRVLGQQPPYDDDLTGHLRASIGDWRDPITWPEGLEANPVERLAFYNEKGLDSRTTDFSADAFDEIVNIAGLAVRSAPNLHDQELSEEERSYARTNRAHDCLQRFERSFRRFIERKMTSAFGRDWVKQKVPGEIRDDWERKRHKALENGEQAEALIDYADFTDYIRIIERRDNWDAVFKSTFRRRESIRESFQRLHPIRLCTMHARYVTNDDELFLLVEIKRITASIKDDAD